MAGEPRSCTGTTRTLMPKPKPEIRDSKRDNKGKIMLKTYHLLNHHKLNRDQKAEPEESEIQVRQP